MKFCWSIGSFSKTGLPSRIIADSSVEFVTSLSPSTSRLVPSLNLVLLPILPSAHGRGNTTKADKDHEGNVLPSIVATGEG
jgi:hypothetical protein